MLHGMMKQTGKRSEQIITALQNSEWDFYLTGSRFFGGDTKESDWDFYAQDSKGIREYLEKLGMTSSAVYGDILYEYHDHNIAFVYRSYKVHVQLQRNCVMKHKAQEIMKLTFPIWSKVTKKLRVQYWSDAYHLISVLDGIDLEWWIVHNLQKRRSQSSKETLLNPNGDSE